MSGNRSENTLVVRNWEPPLLQALAAESTSRFSICKAFGHQYRLCVDEYVNVEKPLQALRVISAFRTFMTAMLLKKMKCVLPKHVCVIIHRYLDGIYSFHSMKDHVREQNFELIPKVVPSVKSVAFAIPLMFTSTYFTVQLFRPMLHFLTERLYFNNTIYISINNVNVLNPRVDPDLKHHLQWYSSNIADLLEHFVDAINAFKDAKEMGPLRSPLSHTCWSIGAPQGDHPSLMFDDYESDDQCYLCYLMMLDILHAFIEKFQFSYRFNLQESMANYMAARRLLAERESDYDFSSLPIVEEMEKEIKYRYFGGRRVAQHTDTANARLFDAMLKAEEAQRSVNRRRQLIAPLPDIHSNFKRPKTEEDEENIDDVDLVCEETLNTNN